MEPTSTRPAPGAVARCRDCGAAFVVTLVSHLMCEQCASPAVERVSSDHPAR